PSTRQEALELNLSATTYGTFAEIGGGQEVARWFFSVGGAAGTVAKTISAYDMVVSDSLYGPTQRYVSRQRLEAMLRQEFGQLLALLGRGRGDAKRFFSFADTVSVRGYRNSSKARGWIGVRFQARPHDEPSEIVLHAHFFDTTKAYQQEALGVLGVNLIYAAFFCREDQVALIGSLMDDLSRERVEVDMIKFSGPAFAEVDNRLMTVQLVAQGLTDAAMFTAGGEVVQPSEVLHKKPILVERGSFRPATKLTLDLLNRAREQFLQEPGVRGQSPVVLAEMTLRSLIPLPLSREGERGRGEGDVGHADFLARADILRALGFDVLISRFEAFHELAEYLAGYTDQPIGIAVGLPTFRQVPDEKFYTGLPGGALESAGRLFQRSVTVYVHPTRDPVSGQIETIEDAPIPAPWHHLHALLLELGRVVPIRDFDESYLSIRTADVLARLQSGDPSWEEMVPANVVAKIKAKNLFGWQSATELSPASVTNA
ncbi:MAG TPA: hypothetical protein VG013_09775, partial [Gemmataceae bacterium]|nr:hypothetical protein [Gemmataceae bacterium]